MHKDWTDAFRESFPEEVRPADGGWEAVAGRLRRTATRRRAAIAAAVLALPLASGLLFFHPRSSNTSAPGPVTAQASEPIEVAPTPVEAVPIQDTPVPVEVIPGRKAPVLLADVTDAFVDLRSPQNDEESGLQPSQNDDVFIPGDIIVIPSKAKEFITEATESFVDLQTPQNDIYEDLLPTLDDIVYVCYDGRRHTVSLGVHAGSTTAGATTSLTTNTMARNFSTKADNNYFNNASGTILQHEYFHDLPVSLGLTARYALNDRISLESGLDFTRLHSRLDDLHSTMFFAGIPLRMEVILFTSGPFEVYSGIGGEAEKCLKATLGGMKCEESHIQWSGSAFLGAQTRISRSSWLYFQPEFTYYFTKTSLISYRTENRLGITLNAGLRFDISK